MNQNLAKYDNAWLQDYDVGHTVAPNLTITESGSTMYYNWQPWTYSYSPTITLTVEEALHLKKLAAKDAKLRKVMQKFAPHIAVSVKF